MEDRGARVSPFLRELTASNQDLVRPVLITQLRSIALARFLFRLVSRYPPITRYKGTASTHKFDGHLLVVQEVGALKNDTKRTLADLLTHTVVDTHYIRGRRRHGKGLRGRWSGNETWDHGVTASGRQARDLTSRRGAVSTMSIQEAHDR